MKWVYIRSEPELWTVGFYDPSSAWHSDSDHNDREAAARRVHYLNGGGQGEAGLHAALSIALTNADVVADPRMDGTTDCYAFALDDVEALRAALAKVNGEPTP